MQSVSAAAEHRAPSPTLTNPDMILPDYDDGAMSPDRSHSPLMMWKNAHTAGMGFELSPGSFAAAPITPTTPIIYGNGTMLSDIGEVTEVESTCGPTRSRSGSTRSEIAIVTSTALPYEAIKQRIKQSRMAHQRQASVDSNSTVTAHDQGGLFADFDDTVSVDDSNFQGDDEDSVADSYVEDHSVHDGIPLTREPPLNPDEARYSTPLSRRAEQILANAKRRLTVSPIVIPVIPEILLNFGRRWKAIFTGPDHHFTLRPQWAPIRLPRHPSEDRLPPLALATTMGIGNLRMGTTGYRVRATFQLRTHLMYPQKGL